MLSNRRTAVGLELTHAGESPNRKPPEKHGHADQHAGRHRRRKEAEFGDAGKTERNLVQVKRAPDDGPALEKVRQRNERTG